MRTVYENKALFAAPANKGWNDPCIVAAPGPSLTEEVAKRCRYLRWFDRWRVIAVQDAYKLMPWADAMYGCNPSWWRVHQECKGFRGEKWSSHDDGKGHLNDKREIADKFGVRLVKGRDGEGFSFEPGVIHYGSNSGFQAINLALMFGCTRIVLVGFDMQYVGGKSHFFGDHPGELHQNRPEHYMAYLPEFARAAKLLPQHVSIINATPGSALKCFPMMSLEDAVKSLQWNDRVHSDRPEPHARADRNSETEGLHAIRV